MAKNKLHQLLAVVQDLTNKAGKIKAETVKTFKDKQSHFDGHVRTYRPFAEVDPLQLPAPEIKEIVTTVDAKLRYTQGALIKAIDAHVSKEETNSMGNAYADLGVGDTAFGKLSAVALLALEGWLKTIRDIYDAIPTQDPATKWSIANIPGVWEAAPKDAYRTEKVTDPVVLYDATPEHPAQTQLVTLDRNVGIVRTEAVTGRFTPREKSERLDRIDALAIAVKQARAKANQADVENRKVGRAIFDYIDGVVLTTSPVQESTNKDGGATP